MSRARLALLLLLGLWLGTLIVTPLVGSQPISFARVLHGEPTASSANPSTDELLMLIAADTALQPRRIRLS